MKKKSLYSKLKANLYIDNLKSSCIMVFSLFIFQVYSWGDNDHGQQGNGTTLVNRKPSLVHGFGDVKVNRVACGSSHSVAWVAPDPKPPVSHEPVLFAKAKDPLGTSLLGGLISKIKY